MHLRKLDVGADSALRRKMRNLYRVSFPKEERLPWWILRLNACRDGIDLTAWLDGDVFCGFTSSVTVEGLHFVLFLAVEPELHSKGYGSAILQELRRSYDCVVLNVETLDPSAPNYPQRQRRFAFYQRNGFVDTGYHVWEVGGMFRVLSTKEVLDVPHYKRIFKKLTFGLWDVRLEKAET